ncbi:MAG: response regulator [Clostridiales bacterium]|nr:response regulator [Clostridiales bacterium]
MTLSRLIVMSIAMLLAGIAHCSAHTLRHFTNADGLNNSAVMSICQASNGLVWLGTYDGLNTYDGLFIRPFARPDNQELSGNMIFEMTTTGDNDVWLSTNYGIDCIKSGTNQVITYKQFKGVNILRKNDDDVIFVLSRDNSIWSLNSQKQAPDAQFSQVQGIDTHGARIKNMFTHENDLYIVTSTGITRYICNASGENDTDMIMTRCGFINYPIVDCYCNDGDVFIVDRDERLCMYNIPDNQMEPLVDVSEFMASRGRVSTAVIARDNSLFVGFKNNGVIHFIKDESNIYQPEDIGIRGGIFRLKRDKWQDVIWIGTDGQGIFIYADDKYSIRTIDFSQIANSIICPVRSIILDKNKNLWIGTKGDGIVRINDFDIKHYPIMFDFDRITSHNSKLSSNLVYSYGESRHDIIWIGTENGLNYYNYETNTVQTVPGGKNILYVHSIYEENDSTLWLASVGMGVYKVKYTCRGNNPVVESTTIYNVDNGVITSNYFFGMTCDDNGDLWFTNRGSGIYKIVDEELVPIPLDNKYASDIINDAFCVKVTGDTLWVGTGNGLLMKSPREEKLFSQSSGFPKSSIHCIEKDPSGYLWVSTNKGLVNMDIATGRVQTYSHANGLDILEYSDDASFAAAGLLFFGGINGVAAIQLSSSPTTSPDFKPTIHLTRLTINGREVLRDNYTRPDGSLHFSPIENNLSLSFAAPDHIDGDAYRYYYNMSDTNSWKRLGKDNTVTFTDMPYGDYTLNVKYFNPVSGIESDIITIDVHIDYPWYLSTWARVIYITLAITAIILVIFKMKRKMENNKNMILKDMEQAHKEEIYEDKLRFFTNITHELCTPLTLIYGPCQRLLSYNKADPYITRYASLIKSNAERLNALIQEVIDFRRMETGNKKLTFQNIDISQLCTEIADSFTDLADQNDVYFLAEITPSIHWNTDKSALSKILFNLVSNAFKYTNPKGTIKLSVSVDAGNLKISVYNTGKGISAIDIDKLFERYKVLDNVKENHCKGLSARNGLGLAICHSLAKLLGGNIDVESVVGQYAELIVTIPPHSCDTPATQHPDNNPIAIPTHAGHVSTQQSISTFRPDNEPTKETILVIDDNADMLLLLYDSLKEYDVKTAESADEALEILKISAPSLIITDIMMPGTDGMEFTRSIKENPFTQNIPVIILSAKNENRDKVAGINSGADVYINKPFDIEYLRAIISRLLKSRSKMKEYFNTAASAYEYVEGKLLNQSDREFIKEITRYVVENIENPDLKVEHLATHVNTGVRNIYRRFKELDLPAPNEFIRNQRLLKASRLLLNTNMNIQEIMYQCGFSYRSYFYKAFAKQYNCTPRAYRQAAKSETQQPVSDSSSETCPSNPISNSNE